MWKSIDAISPESRAHAVLRRTRQSDVSSLLPPRPLHVVFLVRSFGFPHGMANANRVRLLGRAMVEQDVEVNVLCTRVSERPGFVRNPDVRGVVDGISYQYTSGATVRSDSFAARRYREARGYVGALVRLISLKRAGQMDCVYLWSGARSWRIAPWVLVKCLSALRVPVVVELNERPWPASRLPGAVGKHLSLLDGISGAVAISAYLATWASAEARRLARTLAILELPIVVDVAEQIPTEYGKSEEVLVYAASPGYDMALTFILNAMRDVWRRHPDCRLVVTGGSPIPPTASKRSICPSAPREDHRVEYVGYVSRDKLLELFAEARALLIPLFADERSQARFPSKIGEYLAAARPVVTTNVGEIDRYLRDGETAYISAPGDEAAYAAKIVRILEDPAEAAAVGWAGRRVAEERFHYALHGARLRAFVAPLPGRRQREMTCR